MINLVKNTISENEINLLIDWLKTNPRLTKGNFTETFQKKWNEYLGRKSSIFVSSGSSANLAAFYSLKLSNKLKNNVCILPAVSWSTTVAPAIQLGYDPILCDCNLKNYGLDLDHLKFLIKKYNPGLVVTCNVLGFANDYDEIIDLCKKNDIMIIEDSCESVGTLYKNKMTGCFGDISTFSFYYGHHMSTIEGGMVCTDDPELSKIITSIRCHGWDRDLNELDRTQLRNQFMIDDFRGMYSFYYPGFNMRCSDLQAFIGVNQLDRLEEMNKKRHDNFNLYKSLDKSSWDIDIDNYQFISNMAYPVMVENVNEMSKKLNKNNIENRPLICGSIGRQPFWVSKYGLQKDLKNADKIHDYGIYVPNNPDLSKNEIELISKILWD